MAFDFLFYKPKSQKVGSETKPVARAFINRAGDLNVTFCGKGGARKRADIFLQKKVEQSELCSSLVGEGGFEPPKSLTTDLQSAPFGHSGIPPQKRAAEVLELVDGLEPPTC